MRAQDFLPRLKKVRRSGRGWTACCPAHDDHNPSFSIADGDRGILFYCFAGCTAESIKSALGIGDIQSYTPPIRKIEPVTQTVDFQRTFNEWETQTDLYFLDGFAMTLGVETDALIQIGCAWADKQWAQPEKRKDATPAWAFPMRDATGQMIGIRLRANSGAKWALPGSRNGLFFGEWQSSEVGWIVEGPSDTAAALTIGLPALGRPTCSACDEMVVSFVKTNRIRRAVIITDNDQPDKHGIVAGWRGAQKLQTVLPIPSCIWIPPTKDLREFVNRGGDASMIESSIKNLVWAT